MGISCGNKKCVCGGGTVPAITANDSSTIDFTVSGADSHTITAVSPQVEDAQIECVVTVDNATNVGFDPTVPTFASFGQPSAPPIDNGTDWTESQSAPYDNVTFTSVTGSDGQGSFVAPNTTPPNLGDIANFVSFTFDITNNGGGTIIAILTVDGAPAGVTPNVIASTGGVSVQNFGGNDVLLISGTATATVEFAGSLTGVVRLETSEQGFTAGDNFSISNIVWDQYWRQEGCLPRERMEAFFPGLNICDEVVECTPTPLITFSGQDSLGNTFVTETANKFNLEIETLALDLDDGIFSINGHGGYFPRLYDLITPPVALSNVNPTVINLNPSNINLRVGTHTDCHILVNMWVKADEAPDVLGFANVGTEIVVTSNIGGQDFNNKLVPIGGSWAIWATSHVTLDIIPDPLGSLATFDLQLTVDPVTVGTNPELVVEAYLFTTKFYNSP